MRIPHLISANALEAYKTPDIFLRYEAVKSDNLKFVDGYVKKLREYCLITIAKNWEKAPLFDELEIPQDRYQLVEILSTKLPLELTVRYIPEGYYWERCFKDHWPDASLPSKLYKFEKVYRPDVVEDTLINFDDGCSQSEYTENSGYTGTCDEVPVSRRYMKDLKILVSAAPDAVNNIIYKTWKQLFVEKYVAEYLENMTPDVFNEEYIKELTDTYGEYIISLKLNQLQCCKNEELSSHISLYTVLENLPNLIELSVCFNKENLKDNFSWHTTRVSERDCEMLGKGITKSNIEIIRVHRSQVDCIRVKLLVRSLETHPTLRVLDFSHCHISDDGALAIAGVLMKNRTIDTLTLTNNKIGVKGAQGIAYYLCQEESNLVKLDLKLNPLLEHGGRYIATALARGAKTLKHLSLSACGFTTQNFTFGNALCLNDTLERFDLSNNALGEESGLVILEKLEENKTLLQLDLRMCGISNELTEQIYAHVKKNMKGFLKHKHT